MPRYKEIEHTADIGVEIYGTTLEELFQNAGYALFDTIVDVSTIQPFVSRMVAVEGQNVEALLMNWLRELLYLCSVEQEVYGCFEVKNLSCSGSLPDCHAPDACTARIEAIVKGEPLDFQKHRFATEIKAITYHQFAVTQNNTCWQARVIFDV
jgi:SHS2 domain-containing protein